MKYTVVYEMTADDVKDMLFGIIILLASVVAVAVLATTGNKTANKKIHSEDNISNIASISKIKLSLYILFCFIMMLFLFAFFAISIKELDIDGYINTKKYYSEYQNGNYSVASGKITAMQTSSDFFDTPDHFRVRGVLFYFYDDDNAGYHRLYDEYSRIKGNGQQVRITYYHDKDLNRNIILKLETAES